MLFYVSYLFFVYIHPFFTRHVPFPNVDPYICIWGGIFCGSIFQSGFHHPMEGMEDLVAEYRESLIEKARSIDWGLGLGSSRLHLKPGAF